MEQTQSQRLESSSADHSKTPNSENVGLDGGPDGPSAASGVTTQEMCQLTGATYRMMDYWDRKGFLVPAVNQARGSGNPLRLFARWQVGRVRSLVALSRFMGRLPPNLAKMIAAEPERTYHATYSEGPVTVLVTFGGPEDWSE